MYEHRICHSLWIGFRSVSKLIHFGDMRIISVSYMGSMTSSIFGKLNKLDEDNNKIITLASTRVAVLIHYPRR